MGMEYLLLSVSGFSSLDAMPFGKAIVIIISPLRNSSLFSAVGSSSGSGSKTSLLYTCSVSGPRAACGAKTPPIPSFESNGKRFDMRQGSHFVQEHKVKAVHEFLHHNMFEPEEIAPEEEPTVPLNLFRRLPPNHQCTSQPCLY